MLDLRHGGFGGVGLGDTVTEMRRIEARIEGAGIGIGDELAKAEAR